MLFTLTLSARSLAIALAVSALSVVSLSGCADDASASNPQASGPSIARGNFERALLLTGALEAVRSIEIKAPQTAVFQTRIQFMAEEGSEVRTGDPLVDFDNTVFADQAEDLENRILDAETTIVSRRNELETALKDLQIELAEREFAYESAKVRAQIDPSIVSRRDFEERRFQYEKATRELNETKARIALTQEQGRADLDVLEIDRDKLRADLLKAKEALRVLSIKAPAPGLVVYERRQGTTLRFQEGDSCWPGTTVMRLPDLGEMRVVFDVNEVDAPLLRVGMPVRIELDSFPGRSVMGHIAQIPSMAVRRDESSKIALYRVVARLDETWVGEMKPGMSALGTLIQDERANVLLARRDRVRWDGTTYWLRTDDGSERAIEPLARNERHYVLADDWETRAATLATNQEAS
ncbi:MAG: HlyD family efflux transporter periplasmic adaptor subunit [Acidobacteria bacterium]|nr:HlyD family efflux transporter periplasmic adaptor subunit [Acidobacteriota bacterium]